MIRFVRSKLADGIIYQTNYVKNDWEQRYGVPDVPSRIIYNSVDLNKFKQVRKAYKSPRKNCIISVEGTQGLDPFDTVIHLGKKLDSNGIDFEILMFGEPFGKIEEKVDKYPFIKFMGPIEHSQLPYFYAGADCYLLTDIIGAGCPNSALEALACGTPVLGYDVGVISELLDRNSGVLIKQSGNPWKKQSPGNYNSLALGAIKLFSNKNRFREGAFKIAMEKYDHIQMTDKYIEILFKGMI